MIICKVIGHVWATKKEETLTGAKLMIVQEEETNVKNGAVFVAADVVGAGVGEQVLVVSGSTARRALGRDNVAVDCAIVGIIDTLEVEREKEGIKASKSSGIKRTRKKAADIKLDASETEKTAEYKNGLPVQFNVDDIIKLEDEDSEEQS